MPISDYLKNLREKIGTQLVLMPGVNAIVFNDAGELLLQKAMDGNWYTPGGAIDPDEQPADAAAREVLEETGLVVDVQRLVGVFTETPVTYGNGDRVQYVIITFRCRAAGGTLAVGDDESLEVKFFPLDQLPPLRPDQKLRIDQALAGDTGRFQISGDWK